MVPDTKISLNYDLQNTAVTINSSFENLLFFQCSKPLLALSSSAVL